MHIGDHRPDIAGRIALAVQSLTEVVHEGLVALGKGLHIRLIDRVVLPLRGHPDVFVGQNKGTNGGIERESMHASSDAVDENGGRPIDHIARRHLFGTGLHEPPFDIVIIGVFGTSQDREGGSHTHAHVDVRRSIEGIEDDGVLGIGGGVLNGDGGFVLFGGENADVFAHTQVVVQHVVGVDVEFLLDFPLHVHGPMLAENVAETGTLDLGLDHLGGQRNPREQPREFARGSGKLALILQDVLLNGDDRFALGRGHDSGNDGGNGGQWEVRHSCGPPREQPEHSGGLRRACAQIVPSARVGDQ